MNTRRHTRRPGFTVRDLAVTLTCLLVGASLLLSMTGATRGLSQTQTCADNLRQLFTGLTSYVSQYNCYPPHNPYPLYMGSRTINGISTIGWDPNIGFIMTHGLGLVPPATDTYGSGHFIWFETPFASLPDVCKCPSLPPATLDPSNPELDPGQLEPNLYQYALSYQTSGTFRSATQLATRRLPGSSDEGGRNPPIPDPTGAMVSGQQSDNSQFGNPGVWVYQHDPSAAPDANQGTNEYNCFVQAVSPAEVQAPSRVYYLADSRDYRPNPPGTTYTWPPAGRNFGSSSGWLNKVFLGTRHFEYANVMYLDGRVSRGNQTHDPHWNMTYDPSGNGQSIHWRSSTFATDIRVADIHTQVHIMPVLMVKGWEYFFETNGVVAK